MRELHPPESGTAADAWRAAVERGRRPAPAAAPRRDEETVEEWVLVPEEGEAAPRPARRARSVAPGEMTGEPTRARRKAPSPVADELVAVAGAKRAPRLEERLMEAARAFDRERYLDARRILRPLAEAAPAAAAVRELNGLALYRLERWAAAAKELEAYRSLSGAVDQHPVLADCYRALRKFRKVDALWEELRAASPGAELVSEGRIVVAGALADQGDVRGAIVLLERGGMPTRRPKPHHLRQWYALGDLYERAGDVPRARDLFRRVAAAEPDFADVAERLSALG